jgi:opacity protein-like surface antigen
MTTIEEDRAQVLAQARRALDLDADHLEEAARRFSARIESEQAREQWRGSVELIPMLRSWGRVMVLGAIGIGLVALSMARCPLYEQAIAPLPSASDEAPQE